MIRAGEVRLPPGHSKADLEREVEKLGVGKRRWVILRRSLDARRKPNLQWVYSIGVLEDGDELDPAPPPKRAPQKRPIVVGSGPAGLFCAWWLARAGVPPIVVEQGLRIPERAKSVAAFFRYGDLNPRSNLCFGEGGAGAFSDGKLTSRSKSWWATPVRRVFARLSGRPEVVYDAHPHLGSGGVRRCVAKLVAELESLGVSFLFGKEVIKLAISGSCAEGVELDDGTVIESGAVFLAPGHGARRLMRSLIEQGVSVEFKPFAVGVRVEHPADLIDRIQFGEAAGKPGVPRARYHLAISWKSEGRTRSLYTFCMCPGGWIVNAATENSGCVTNGMSSAGKRSGFSNAAFVVNVGDGDIPGSHPLRGVSFQAEIERAAAQACNQGAPPWRLPAQRLVDFLEGRPSHTLPPSPTVVPLLPARVDQMLPEFVVSAIRRGMETVARRMRGFVCRDALVVAPETRTSSPVRITRDRETWESTSTKGLFPIGEGAGYAGGIVSAACDGIAAAQAYLERLPSR